MRTSLVLSSFAAIAVLAAIVVTPAAVADVVSCSLPDKSFREGDVGIFAPTFKADCTGLVPHDLLFHERTADGTAVAPDDYIAIDFDAGPNGQELEVAVAIVGDTVAEPDETFTVTVSDPSGRVVFSKPTSTVTIVDDEKPRCSIDDASFPEGDGGSAVHQLHAECDQPLTEDLHLQVSTSEGTASEGQDYVAITGSDSVAAGETSWAPEVQILGDTANEPDETFTYTVSDPAETVFFVKNTATVTIHDDDQPTTGACITLSETSVSVEGTASTPSHRGVYGTNPDRLTVTNCGTGPVQLAARGTDATGAAGSWQLVDQGTGSTCELGPNVFRASFVLLLSGGGVGIGLTPLYRLLPDADGTTAFTLAAGDTQDASPSVELPCDGSVGLGDPMTMDITLTAVAP
jgi:hypothetical protein